VAFRMIGQPWGRMVFLPFLGGLAMPRLPYESDAQHAFAALMGPGFSVVALLPGVALALMGLHIPDWIVQLAVVVAMLNLFNLIPVEPLDGGVALRTAFSRIFGRRAQLAMMASNGLIGLAGILLASPALALLGFVAAFANLRPRISANPPARLTGIQLAQVFGGFVIVAAAHVTGMATVYYHRLSYLHNL
jgi:Zn-dependent protease